MANFATVHTDAKSFIKCHLLPNSTCVFFLDEAQLSLATAQEKERVAAEQLIEGSARLATLESQVTSLKQERSRLMAQLEMERTRIEVLEDAKNK